MKKIFALFFFIILIISCNVAVFSANAQTEASLYSYYGNNMLFKQNDDAVFAGTASAGSEISLILCNSKGETVAESKTVTLSDGTFSLKFTSPAGSFEEYTVTLAEDGKVFTELSGVVFGELWLAGGQSNMQMSLISSKTGYQMALENKRGSDALRFFHVPYLGGVYKGNENNYPASPLTDYECNVGWYKGSDTKVFELSAVGYYFAENLIKELNMPVGVLNANMGGTSIITWLSRETIESTPDVLADCKSDNRYIPFESWNESNVNFSLDMTCNFNKITAPLKNFRLSGMIWYQGEGDIAWAYGRYSRAFNALQNSYSKYFNYNGTLPIVFTQLASYSYGHPTVLQNTNVEFSHIQQQSPNTRALTSIYDVPLDYDIVSHAIHPICKKEVGDKMAYAALGLVYKKHTPYTSATPQKTEVKGNSIYITFRDVGDKLVADGETLNGFSICGSNGIYVSAKAQIVSADTVKVFSNSVKSPLSVAYAYSQANIHANLFASKNGQKLLAVSPFVTDLSLNRHHFINDWWTTCDFEKTWHCHTNENSGFYNTWEATNGALSFRKSEIDSGNAMYIKANGTNSFAISPKFIYETNGTAFYFEDLDLNWSNYKTLSFKVKVKSENPVQFNGLSIFINENLWVAPGIKDAQLVGCTIPADGNAHTIMLDLNRLYPFANAAATPYKSDILGCVFKAEFNFTGTGISGTELCFDEVSFGTEALNFSASDSLEEPNFFEKIKAFFISLYTKIMLFFQNLFK